MEGKEMVVMLNEEKEKLHGMKYGELLDMPPEPEETTYYRKSDHEYEAFFESKRKQQMEK